MSAVSIANYDAVRPVVVSLGDAEIELCRRHARSAEIGGASNVRSLPDRAEALATDQLVGQLATLAGTKWLYGLALGHYAYRTGRWAADRAPERGDGGADVPGSNIDFKGSLIRHPGRSLDAYRLAVRDRERHPGTVYVLALVSPDLRTVYLLGWATDDELPPPDTEGTFEGARTIPAPDLTSCPPFAWTL